jgi:hypothetical protein
MLRKTFFTRLISTLLLPLFAANSAELPVREVILFKHGVGFFSRSGEVKGGDTVRLDFKASDMNDVLKSLTVEEKGGGRVTGLRYDASEPLGQKLAEFPFKIGDAFSLSAVLDQMKGARVELRYGTETLAGQIVSGREATGVSADRPTREQLVMLLDSGDIRMFDMTGVTGIKFLDPLLQRQFSEYLRAVSQSRSKEKRSLYVDSTGTASRTLTANYMTPSPVWKSSYRLMFTQNEPTLEGWAIVDNTTDEDWNNVQLAVVSGRPISFISRLYEPRYRQRQVAELAEERTVGPVVYESAMQSAAAAPPPAPAGAAKSPRMMMGMELSRAAGNVNMEASPMMAVEVSDSTVAVNTQGRELGELFEYRFSTPITVKKSESAMLPFLQQKLNSRKILIYQESQGANPMNAAEVSNTTGKTLDGGPITVYDSGVYAGEALMETLKAGDKRLISYAVDLGTRVSTSIDSSRSNVRQVNAKRGIVTTRYALQETKVYTIRNVDAKAKTLIIEHPLRPGYKLTSAVKPTETTTNAYRFEIKLAPQANEKFTVQEENLYDETTAVSSMTPDSIVSFLAGRSISDAGRRQLEQIAERKRQSADAENQARAVEVEMNELIRDQERLRQNIGSLRNITGQEEQVQRYSRQLASQETQIATMRDQIRDQRRKKQTLDREIQALVEKLEF